MAEQGGKRPNDLRSLAARVADFKETRALDDEENLHNALDSAIEYLADAADEAASLDAWYSRSDRQRSEGRKAKDSDDDIPFMREGI